MAKQGGEVPTIAQSEIAFPAYNQVPILDDSPPSYSNETPTEVLPVSNTLPIRITHPPKTDFRKYNIPQSTTSGDQLQTTVNIPKTTLRYQSLLQLLQEQAALPPKPLVRIIGTNEDNYASYNNRNKIDFDLSLNILPFIIALGQNQRNYLRLPVSSSTGTLPGRREGPGGLEDCARRFCKETAEIQSITIERTVTNWDTEYLEGQIRNLIASTKYRGNITITFPITFSKVTLQKDGNLLQSWIGAFGKSGARDDMIIESVWPYASAPPGSSEQRAYAVQSEQQWWRDWKIPIRNAIMNKKRGWVSAEDWMEAAMGLNAKEPYKEWGAVKGW